MEKRTNQVDLLVRAQENKSLAYRLMNMRCHVDQTPPKSYPHLAGNVKYQKKVQRNINIENGKMLKKIMSIMNRKPEGNGLDGFKLKPQPEQNN